MIFILHSFDAPSVAFFVLQMPNKHPQKQPEFVFSQGYSTAIAVGLRGAVQRTGLRWRFAMS